MADLARKPRHLIRLQIRTLRARTMSKAGNEARSPEALVGHI